jgi:glutamate 5-kinase
MRGSDVEFDSETAKPRRIVVKVGTRLVIDTDGQPQHDFLMRMAREIRSLMDQGMEVLLVTSGAVGIGRRIIFDRPGRLLRVSERPSAAAVGQPILMRYWAEALDEVGITCAQVLLTQDDVVNRRRCMRLRETLEDLLNWDVLPVLNENDSVSTEAVTFGENDLMAAMVAVAITPAQLLVMLSDQAGLFTADPRSDAEAELICQVEPHEDVARFASGAGGPESLGGMTKKVEAARRATDCGIRVVIADGNADRVLERILSEEQIGTCMFARPRMPSRKAWLAMHLMPSGTLVVDDGARRALLQPDGASLLPSGITEVRGDFRSGDLVIVRDIEGREIARGLVNYSSEETEAIMGAQSSEIPQRIGREGEAEVIHRDDMVISAP